MTNKTPMQCINFKGNPDLGQLAALYDDNVNYHKEVIKITFEDNGCYILLQRKYTYKGNRVIKTQYLHGVLYDANDKEHTILKEKKDGSFNLASYYR